MGKRLDIRWSGWYLLSQLKDNDYVIKEQWICDKCQSNVGLVVGDESIVLEDKYGRDDKYHGLVSEWTI